MKETETHLALEGGDVVVRRFKDLQDTVDATAALRGEPQRGDFRHVWHLDNIMVDKFFQEYCGLQGGVASGAAKNMDQEFWNWVNKKMKDPEYAKFRTDSQANQLRVGYHDGK